MDYGYAITRAWKITWKYKILWIFGILAGCGSTGGSNNSSEYSRSIEDMPPEIIEMGDKALIFFSQPVVIIGLIIFVLFFIMLITFFSTIGRVGLISGTYKAEMDAEKLSFGELLKDGKSRFWPFFGMNFLVSLPFIIVIFGLIGAGIFVAFSADNATNAEEFLVGFIPVICVIFCCLFLFSLVIGMIMQQAQNAMIIEELGISASIMRGWEIFKNGLGHIILIAIILFIIGAIVGVSLALPVLVVVVPSIISFVLHEAKSFQPLIIAGLCLVAYLPIALIANGVLTTYAQAVWTLTYLQLSEETPKITKEDTIVEYA
ncbi:MAG: hypothetical protein HN392_10630 [Anaerolineae bacterium]|jgi:hypothetical protein|nr:hypothetical protein [Anaerolineae bacterium]MBT7075494.1 hypothetical protein [Anaerolineae bacterium]MBT7781531.1 hypothetical protein [Anaerolineae bacterium]